MPQPDDMLSDVEIADPAVEAVLGALTVAEGMAARIHAETELLEGETRRILLSNHALLATGLLSVEAAQAAVVSVRRGRF